MKNRTRFPRTPANRGLACVVAANLGCMDQEYSEPTNAASLTSVATRQLLERAAAGDQDAARELYSRYFRRLLGLARSRLDGLERQKVEAEDVVQSAFKSFFVLLEDGQFSLDESGDVWPLLVRITLRKCGHKLEHWSAVCRDTNRDATPPPSPDDSHAVWEPIACGPSPLEGVIFAETSGRAADSVLNWYDGLTIARAALPIMAAVRRTERSEVSFQGDSSYYHSTRRR
jgi:DNA-directed RNA polymerase specialized sigma24 family protein